MFGGWGNKADPSKDSRKEFLEVKRKIKEETEVERGRIEKEGDQPNAAERSGRSKTRIQS